jgi:hypothetical protein
VGANYRSKFRNLLSKSSLSLKASTEGEREKKKRKEKKISYCQTGDVNSFGAHWNFQINNMPSLADWVPNFFPFFYF